MQQSRGGLLVLQEKRSGDKRERERERVRKKTVPEPNFKNSNMEGEMVRESNSRVLQTE